MFLLKTPAVYLLLMVSSFRLKKKKEKKRNAEGSPS